MPRKTRKQKIRARSKKEKEWQSKETSSSSLSYQFTDNYLKETIRQKVPDPKISQAFPTSYIIKDLKKTFILTGLAIIFELVLYWFLR